MPEDPPPDPETLSEYFKGSLPEAEACGVRAWLSAHPNALPNANDQPRSNPPSGPVDRPTLESPANPITHSAPTSTGIPELRIPSRFGAYRVLYEVGRGGMGIVLAAEDDRLQRVVAIKVLHPGTTPDNRARARFLREARAAAAIRHEYVIPVYDVGEQDGIPFLVMPILEGQSLATRLTAAAPLVATEVVRIGREAAEGLAAAHTIGLIHRDVKPENIWLESPGDRVRLLDFGLARSEHGQDGVSMPGAVVGTAAYMSPEQADGQPVDFRSDLFSLGVVLYFAATGVRPFARAGLLSTLRAVSTHEPSPVSVVNPAVSVPLSNLIMWMLAKRPAARPESALAVVVELKKIGAGIATPVKPEPAAPIPPQHPAAATEDRARVVVTLSANRSEPGGFRFGCAITVSFCLLVAWYGVTTWETIQPSVEKQIDTTIVGKQGSNVGKQVGNGDPPGSTSGPGDGSGSVWVTVLLCLVALVLLGLVIPWLRDRFRRL